MEEKLEQILEQLNSIEYGWVGADGVRHHGIGDEFAADYRLQLGNSLATTKLGVCWDQVEYEAYLLGDTPFRRIGLVYYDGKDLPSHTFIVLEEAGQWYWLEHSWGMQKGLHAYANLDELLCDAVDKFVADFPAEDKANFDIDLLAVYDYPAPEGNLTCDEFYRHLEKGEKIKLSSQSA